MNNKPPKEKAGTITWRLSANDEPEVLMITARTIPGLWIFPAGTQEPGETLAECAARECAEESGYTVAIGRQLGRVTFPASDGQRAHRITFFLARQTGEATGYETDRQRKWVPLVELDQHIDQIVAPIVRIAMQQTLSPD